MSHKTHKISDDFSSVMTVKDLQSFTDNITDNVCSKKQQTKQIVS